MSDIFSVKTVKDALAECPICTEYFHDPSRIPRRMPCCSQAICEPCLETYTRGCQKLSCPLCRQQHQIPGGVKSLPKEVVVLRFLDVLKTQSNAVPACIDCPDNNSAMSKCDNCGVYLCQPCSTAHARHALTRQHKITTFEEIQSMRSTRPSSAVPQKKSQDTSRLTEKLEDIKQRMETLSGAEEIIDRSKKFAISEINDCFDELVGELQQRRAILLSKVETKADKVRKSITRAWESHKTLQQKLQKATTNQKTSTSVDALLKESPEDVEYDRLGVTFIPAYIQHLTDVVKAAGQIRTVDFRPTDRPSSMPETDLYIAIHILPDDFPQVPDVDKKIPGGDGEIICPHLEWDRNTASSDVTVSGTEINNTTPNHPPPDTGCRLQSNRRVLATRPVVIRRGQRVMYHLKVRYSIKEVTQENMMIFETSLTSSTADANFNQHTGLSVRVAVCSTHKQQLCLQVLYDTKLLTDITLTRNQVGESRDLCLCFVVDGEEKKIHIVDTDDVRLVTSVTGVRFDRPLWIMVYIQPSSYSNMTGALVSGNKVTVTQEITQLLSSLR